MTPAATRWAKDTTICITTLNRPAYLRRTLSYYSETGFGGVVLIGDGSKDAIAEENAAIVRQFQAAIQVELLAAADMDQPTTMKAMANLVKTKFAVYSGDDDYLIPQGLAACEEALDKHPAFIAMHGKAVALNMNGVHGIPLSANQYILPTTTYPTAMVRLSRFFPNYAVAIFNLHRTEFWREMHSLCDRMPDKAIGGEIGPGAASAALGPTGEIDIPYLVRQIHTSRYHLQSGASWMLKAEFGQSCKVMLDQLVAIIGSADDEYRDDSEKAALLPTFVWNAWMSYICAGHHGCQPPCGQSWEAPAGVLSRQFRDGHLLDAVIDNISARPNADSRPTMLINWGNPYVINDTIAPALPELARNFQIVLLLVDYNLSDERYSQALDWKESGLIKELLVAPSHGGSLAAHAYMRNLSGELRRWNFSVFLTISAMQPYERYLTDWILPKECLRIVFWPHPTNLFRYKPLADAVMSEDRRAITIAMRGARKEAERALWKEFLRPHPDTILIAIFIFLTTLLRPFIASDPTIDSSTADAADFPRTDGRLVTNLPARRKHSRLAKLRWLYISAHFGVRVVRALHRRGMRFLNWLQRLLIAPPLKYTATAGIPALIARILHLDLDRLPKQYYYICDRYILPMIMIGRAIPFEKFDAVTQIGSSRFDACLFLNEDDARLHRILYERQDFFTIRYIRPPSFPDLPPVDAVLLPFTLHDRSDMTDALKEIYRRDLSTALKESGAAEVHIRIHPGRKDQWLSEFVDELRGMGLPCQLVGAERPVSIEAGRYRGVIGAVSAALRDARLANPHIFVVGSMGLSITHFPAPREIVGFSRSIGWIAPDGSYDPAIFTAHDHHEEATPTLAEMVVHLLRQQPGKSTGFSSNMIHSVN